MTPDDTPGGGRGSPRRRAKTDGRYVAYETDDGSFVVRDESDPEAWIRSDTVVRLSTDRA